MPDQGLWPCFFTNSETTGEKNFEEFYMNGEILDMDRFQNLGIVKCDLLFDEKKLSHFLKEIEAVKYHSEVSKKKILNLFQVLIPDFDHRETGKYLDAKM